MKNGSFNYKCNFSLCCDVSTYCFKTYFIVLFTACIIVRYFNLYYFINFVALLPKFPARTNYRFACMRIDLTLNGIIRENINPKSIQVPLVFDFKAPYNHLSFSIDLRDRSAIQSSYLFIYVIN
jgi:hypothetical protein